MEPNSNLDAMPWQLLKGEAILLASPEESVVSMEDFEAWSSDQMV